MARPTPAGCPLWAIGTAKAATVTPGLYNPATGRFYLKNINTSGVADVTFTYGPAGAGWLPIVGDWNNDHIDTVGLYNPATGRFYLRNSNSAGVADVTFVYGAANAGWKPIVGDWGQQRQQHRRPVQPGHGPLLSEK